MKIRNLLKSSECLTGIVKALRLAWRDLKRLQWVLQRPRQVKNYLATHPIKCLQVGCGKNLLHGWLNADYAPRFNDVVYLDATKPFPFPDNCMDFIFSEHMIEHVPHALGQHMLRECHRILKPGGRVRISTPNLVNIASLMASPTTEEKTNYVRKVTAKYIPENTQLLPGFVVNNFFWDFWHYFVYDPDTLAQALKAAGFIDVQQMASRKGSVSELTGLETHALIVGEDLDAFESMVFEGTKP